LKTAGAIKLSSPATREFWEIPVLFEDEHLLALDKPAGLLTSPDRNDPQRPSLMALLHAGIADGKPWARERNLVYLSNAHRPDFEASGVMLLAKNKPALVALADLFGSGKPLKKYTVLAHGSPQEEKFEVDARLSPHPLKTGLMCVDPTDGKKSKTQFEVVERFSGWTLLRCLPFIERTHQIRVHLRHAGFPIAGDGLYGGKPLWLSRLKRDYRLKPGREERPLISRAALHAEKFSLPHPVTGEMLVISAPLPKDFKVALKYLRMYAAGFGHRDTES
jgi:23S rRNA pseudouridine955/2504/2580 synthase/23S rRNA pseudouridine1911/1915/1917 synthase